MDTPAGQRLPIAEAAAVLGLSEKTIRRRIKAGTLRAERVVTPQGHVWLVEVNHQRLDTRGQPVQAAAEDRQLALLELTRTVADELTRSLSNRIEELARENERLRISLEAAESRLSGLEAPQPASAVQESTSTEGTVSRSATARWWRRAWEWMRV